MSLCTEEQTPEVVAYLPFLVIITLYGYFSLFIDIIYLLINVSISIYHWLIPKKDAKVQEEDKNTPTEDKETETIKEEVKPDYKAIKFEEDKQEFDNKFYERCLLYIREADNLNNFKEKAVFANAMYHYIEENLEKILKYNLGNRNKFYTFLQMTYEKIQEFNVDCNVHICMECPSIHDKNITMEEYNTIVLARTLKKTMENYKKNKILLYLLKEYSN
jgi:hypothetical protein